MAGKCLYFVAIAAFSIAIASGNKEVRTTCSLYIRTDPTLWRHVKNSNPNHDDPNKHSEVFERTKFEILSIITNHVSALNYIFRDTKFDGRIEHRGIKFEIQRTKIDTDFDCGSHVAEPNQFCSEDISAPNLLKLHSLENHEDFCLAYLFTYRTFRDDHLGITVPASTDRSGGICEKYKTYTEIKDGRYQSIKRSFNIGVITLAKNYRTLSAAISQLNFARQVGYNFGASDDASDCQPGGQEGNYIMYNGVTEADRPNNHKFSACSIQSISTILDAMESGLRRNCFLIGSGGFCGNKIVEPGEECDCGYDDVECQDHCCYPRQVSNYDKEKNSTAVGCTRRALTQCSPSQGTCCDELKCQISQDVTTPCKRATPCSNSSVCTGLFPACPAPETLPEYTHCDTDNPSSVCFLGECRSLSMTNSTVNN